MANNVAGNPILIDTFGADVVISASKVKLSSIVITARAARNCVFHDSSGAIALDVAVAANQSIPIRGPLYFDNGLSFNDSDSDMAANDSIVAFIARD